MKKTVDYKAKCHELVKEMKLMRHTIKDLTTSREAWKAKAVRFKGEARQSTVALKRVKAVVADDSA